MTAVIFNIQISDLDSLLENHDLLDTDRRKDSIKLRVFYFELDLFRYICGQSVNQSGIEVLRLGLSYRK